MWCGKYAVMRLVMCYICEAGNGTHNIRNTETCNVLHIMWGCNGTHRNIEFQLCIVRNSEFRLLWVSSEGHWKSNGE